MPAVASAITSPNCFSFSINNFHCNIALPDTWGLTDLLTQSADFYAATLEKNKFQGEFRSARAEKVGAILDIVQNPGSKERYSYVDFQIKMLHEALCNRWRYPALISLHHDQLTWHTGGIRLLATGMVMPNRELDLPLLVTDFDRSQKKHFQNVQYIQHDRQLSALLNVDFFRYSQHEPSTTGTRLEIFLEWQNTPGPCLHYIKPIDQSLDWSNQGDLAHVPRLLPAAKKLLDKPQIYYWSQTPDQLRDDLGLFGKKWMGDVPEEFRQSDWTLALYRHVQFGTNPGGIEWWISPGVVLDASELLFWLDQDHTVYLDRDSEFAVMIDHDRYSKKIVSMSKQNDPGMVDKYA